MKSGKCPNPELDTFNSSLSTGAQRPWRGKELARFWVMIREAGCAADLVPALIDSSCPGKCSLHDLTRTEFIRLLNDLSLRVRRPDPPHGRASGEQWAHIMWLQYQLNWTAEHRDNYLKQVGSIDSIRFLTVPIARAAIIGLRKMLRLRATNSTNQTNQTNRTGVKP